MAIGKKENFNLMIGGKHMATDPGKPLEVQLAESQEKVGVLETQLTEAQEYIKLLEDQQAEDKGKIKELKNQLAESKKPKVKAKALGMSQGALKKALEGHIYKSKNKINKLLIRAKHVGDKGFKIHTDITMNNSDNKATDDLALTLEALIRESEDSFKQLLVSVTPDKGKGTRVEIKID